MRKVKKLKPLSALKKFRSVHPRFVPEMVAQVSSYNHDIEGDTRLWSLAEGVVMGNPNPFTPLRTYDIGGYAGTLDSRGDLTVGGTKVPYALVKKLYAAATKARAKKRK